MNARPKMRLGRILPLTLLLSFALQTVVWFFPVQATFASELLGQLHLPLEQEWMRSRSVASHIAYAFGDLMLVVGFCQTLSFVAGEVDHPRPARRRSRNGQTLGLLGGAAMLVGLNLSLWTEMAAGMIKTDRISLIQTLSPVLTLGAGILLAGALQTSRLSPDADTP